MKIKKLNTRGFSHHFVMALIVLVVAIGGTYYLVASHADNCVSTPSGNVCQLSGARFSATDDQTVGTATTVGDLMGTNVTNVTPGTTQVVFSLSGPAGTVSGGGKTATPTTGYQYSLNVSSLPNGTYHLSAIDYAPAGPGLVGAPDGNANLTFNVNNGASAKFTATDDQTVGTGTTVGGTLPTALTAESPELSQATYYVDGTQVATTTNVASNFAYTVNAYALSNGVHHLTATVKDAVGNTGPVTALDGNSSLTFNVENAITTPPAAPAQIWATVVSSSQINLSWSASTGATTYGIYRSSTNSTSPAATFSEIATTPNTEYNNTGLSPSTTYSYYIIAANSVGLKGQQSGPSPTIRMTTMPATTTTTVAAGEQLNAPGARRPVPYVHLCANGNIDYVTQGSPNCLPGGSLILNYASSVPGTYYATPCVTSASPVRLAYIATTEACPSGTSRVPRQLAAGEQLSIAPNRRPVQYLHVCTGGGSAIYVTQGSPSCLPGGTFEENYPSTVAGTVQDLACGTTSGTTMRYAYIQSGEPCPIGTITML